MCLPSDFSTLYTWQVRYSVKYNFHCWRCQGQIKNIPFLITFNKGSQAYKGFQLRYFMIDFSYWYCNIHLPYQCSHSTITASLWVSLNLFPACLAIASNVVYSTHWKGAEPICVTGNWQTCKAKFCWWWHKGHTRKCEAHQRIWKLHQEFDRVNRGG